MSTQLVDPEAKETAKVARSKRVSIDPQGTTHGGLAGLFEIALRRFKSLVHALTLLPFCALVVLCIGLSVAPGIWVVDTILHWTWNSTLWIRYPAIGCAVALAYLLYGLSAILVFPAANFILMTKLKPWRGTYYSLGAVKWYIHNALTYIVRYTILELLTPTPFSHLFYSLLGMKIGKNCQINTTAISDPSLIELGDYVTIGGSATICAHYASGGFLVIAPVRIGSGATIGLRAIVMGGVEIGEKAKILPNSVVLPKMKIPAGETWGGVPAVRIIAAKAGPE